MVNFSGSKLMLGNDTCHFSVFLWPTQIPLPLPNSQGQGRVILLGTGTTNLMAELRSLGWVEGHRPFPGLGSESCIMMAVMKSNNDALMGLALFPS